MLFLRGLARRALSTPRASRIASFNDNSCGSLKQKDTIILQPGEVISVCRLWKAAQVRCWVKFFFFFFFFFFFL
jgi:hypothetical protein